MARRVGLYLNGDNPLEKDSSLDSFHYENLERLHKEANQFSRFRRNCDESFIRWGRKKRDQRVYRSDDTDVGGTDIPLWAGVRNFSLAELLRSGITAGTGQAAADQSLLGSSALAEFVKLVSGQNAAECLLIMAGHADGPLYTLMIATLPEALLFDIPFPSIETTQFDVLEKEVVGHSIFKTDDTPNWLSGRELLDGFDTAGIGAENKIGIVAFDACQEATVEMGIELINYASIFVASELNIPSTGWDYAATLSKYFSAGSAVEASAVIIESYRERYAESPWDGGFTLVALELAHFEGLAAALGDFVSGVLKTDKGFAKLRNMAASLPAMPKSRIRKVDLIALFSALKADGGWTDAITAAIDRVLSFADAAKQDRFWADSVATNSYKCNGMSISLPCSQDDFNDSVKSTYLGDDQFLMDFKRRTQWHTLLDKMMREV